MYKSVVASGLTMMALETNAIKISVEGELAEVQALLDTKVLAQAVSGNGAE